MVVRIARFSGTLVILGVFLLSPLWADDCGSSLPSKSLQDAKVDVTSVSPTHGASSTPVQIALVGNGLTDMTLIGCPQQTGASEIVGQLDPQRSSSETVIHSLLSLPELASTYDLYLLPRDKLARVDLKTQFVITSSIDTTYVDCDFSSEAKPRRANIGCSFVPLSYKTTQTAFGKGIAERFVVVQVTVRNKNTDLEYLLQDIKLGTSENMVASIDKKLARRVAETAELFSARAISFRLVEAGATVLTGIAGVAGNELLKDAANITAGPAQTGFRGSIPDLSTNEINTVSDNGFSVTSTVIPKNSAIAVVAFLSSEAFAPANFKHLTGVDLLKFQRSLNVQVAGIHIQQLDLTKPTLKAIVLQDSSIKENAQLPNGGAPVVLQGTALNAVDSVSFKLEGATPQTFTVKLTAHGGTGALDPTMDDALIPKDTVLHAGIYDLSLVTADGTTIPTSVKMTVPASNGGGGNITLTGLPANVGVGSVQTISVTAIDATGQPNTGFRGAIHLSSGDSAAKLPPDYTFTDVDKGMHQFSITFMTKGNETVTVTSNGLTAGVANTSVN